MSADSTSRRATPRRSGDRRCGEGSAGYSAEVDLNEVVSCNVRAARLLRGWTQMEVAVRLEPYLGRRLSQAGVSSLERAGAGGRKREFDADELLVFALVFDLPVLWFLLPPPGDKRLIAGTAVRLDELRGLLVGGSQPVAAGFAKLRRSALDDDIVEQLTGVTAERFRAGRRQRLAALVEEHGDAFDAAVEQFGRVLDQFRVGHHGHNAGRRDDDDDPDPDVSLPALFDPFRSAGIDEGDVGGVVDPGLVRRAVKEASQRHPAGRLGSSPPTGKAR